MKSMLTSRTVSDREKEEADEQRREADQVHVKGDQAEIKDNGITQQVKVQTGIQLAGMENIRPIVRLEPYRTFPEIDQPESDFLLRVKDDQVGIFEADGGMWKLYAKTLIKAYLENELDYLIDEGKVIVGM